MLTGCSGLMFVPFAGFLSWFIQSNWACVERLVCVRVCLCMCVCTCLLCGSACGFMYLREHHFKTISLQRKQSPLDHRKVSISKIKTKKKKSLICAIRAMPQSNVTVGVTQVSLSAFPEVPRGFTRLGVWNLPLLCSFCHNSGTLNTEGDGDAEGVVRWWSDKNCFRVKHQDWKGVYVRSVVQSLHKAPVTRFRSPASACGWLCEQ